MFAVYPRILAAIDSLRVLDEEAEIEEIFAWFCQLKGNCLGCPLMGTIDRSRPSTSQRVDGSARRHTLPRRRNGGW